ncbi:MAG: carboxypeptidase-like regulatory domain-containing protein, partial [Gemmatimonadetes bacterium]|nr:carboxypeptidase-like regulatory domain-containing protein [Gemmatimonadota bacterium]
MKEPSQGFVSAAGLVLTLVAVQVVSLTCLQVGALEAQVISGRVIDSENGTGVGLAAIIVLDPQRTPLLMRGADTAGVFQVDFPGPGEYYLVIERLGYFETESPLLAVAEDGRYAVDFEMRPEPIRLDPLEVSVSNEKLEDFLTLEFGVHPATLRGYRAIQG